MKIFILAGEASGDIHSANLAREILIQHPKTEIKGWGGDHMIEAGVEVSVHCRKLAFMGFWEVAKNIFTISRLFKKAKKELRTFQPDVLVLVDYPGFNLRLAKFAKASGMGLEGCKS